MIQSNSATHYHRLAPTIAGQLAGGRAFASAGTVRVWFDSRQRRALAELDDRLLDDIGVTRAHAACEAARPFWSAGKA